MGAFLMQGHGRYTLLGADGEVKQSGSAHNLVTDYGDQWAAERTAGVANAEPAVSGFRLGTDAAAPAKSGAGATIGAYVAGSVRALDANYPTVTDIGADGYRATYSVSWPVGVATANGIAECAVTNDAALADDAGNAGNTVARFLLSPVVNKGENDTLQVEWYNDYNGTDA